eukprot:2588712-Pleurochrysis_carterae.AAC.2
MQLARLVSRLLYALPHLNGSFRGLPSRQHDAANRHPCSPRHDVRDSGASKAPIANQRAQKGTQNAFILRKAHRLALAAYLPILMPVCKKSLPRSAVREEVINEHVPWPKLSSYTPGPNRAKRVRR